MTPRAAWKLVKQALSDYFEDKAPRLAAALAYYALFAIAPLLLVCIAIAGLVVGNDTARDAVSNQASSLLGAQGGDFVAGMMDRAGDGRSGTVGAIMGTLALLVGAGGVFVQLQDALNTVWEVKPKPHLPIAKRIVARLSAYAIVMTIAFLLLVSLVVSAGLTALAKWNDALPGSDAIWFVVDAVVSLVILSLLFALLFKHVPDAKVAWRDVWIGSAVTAVLFVVGKWVLGLYLGRPESTATFGGASALIVVALWIYYCSQIVLIGAEFTQAYAFREGSGIQPDEDAVAVTSEARAQQGMTP
jgi:membrane protein